MFKRSSISLAAVNAIQLATLAAVICAALTIPETFLRRGEDGNTAKAAIAARALAGSIDRALSEIDRNGRMLGSALQSQSELSDATKAALLQEWLALQPSLLDAAVMNAMGVTVRAGNRSGAGTDLSMGAWFQPDKASDTLVEAHGLEGGQFLIAVPLPQGALPERLVLRVGPDWLAALQDGVLRSTVLDGARLTVTVTSAEGTLLAGEPSPRGKGERGSTSTASPQGTRGVPKPGWMIAVHDAEGTSWARLGWVGAIVLGAGLCGYGLARAVARRLRPMPQDGDPGEFSASTMRIREFDALKADFDLRARRLDRACEEALSDRRRLRARLGTFETLSGWTCWEVDLLTQRVIWSDLSEAGRETAATDFAGDHAADLTELVDGIDEEDRPLMRLAMQSALTEDGPHDVSLRTLKPTPHGRERRLLVRFRRSSDGSDGAPVRLLALSREIVSAQADPHDEPAVDRHAEADPANERRRDLFLRSIIDGIVHDINDVLTVIGANLAVLKRRGLPDHHGKFLHNAIVGNDRGAAIARRMVTLARRGAAKSGQTDLAACMAALLPFLQAKVLADLPVMNRLPDDLPRVRCDERILEAVVLNLAFHFRESGFDGLALAARAEGQDGERHFVRLLVASGRPSQAGGGGQSARLAMAARLLENTGCELRIVDDGRGREPFHAELFMPAEASQPVPAFQQDSMRGLSILLVEADSLVRSSIADLLSELGHAVTHSPSSVHALQRLSRAHDVDVMITSHALPNLNGVQLAATVAERHPGISVVIAGPHGHLPASAERFHQLDKPFRLEDLVAVLSAVEPQAARAA